ncbi:MAG TPA: heavy metal-binding domain-containing protein [Solirubrobacteraceae bacterium]|nr:heavy metal-binding domain-containing protein [Solirubrobacteraceae bacterium]
MADYDPTSTEGLAAHSSERLAMNRRGLFTSDLSVNEYLCVEKAGFEPVGLVVGSSIYHVGFQFQSLRQNQELDVLSQAMYHARELAMTRMEEEADQLGADGVVGVRLDIGRYEWGADMAEFIAIGTAVRHKGGKLHRAPNGRPFTSDLSGQAFWTLMQTGKRPVGLVMGSCVYHVAHRGVLQTMRQAGRNVELETYTQALYDARELAMERMQAEAQQIGDDVLGIVEVKLRENSHGWGSHVIEFFAVGTAVIANEHTAADHRLPDITPTLDIND